MKNLSTKKLTTLALLCAMSLILAITVRIPLVPAAAFLKFDPKDIVIAIGGFIYGPISALLISVIVSFLELLFTGGNLIDVLMNVISTASFVCTAAIIYKRIHTRSGAFIGLITGMILCTISMLIWNYVVDPFYFNMPRSAVVAMLPGIGLFNILKCSINTCITLVIYKPVVTALRHAGLVEESRSVSGKKSLAALSVFALCTILLLLLTYKGIL